MYWMMVVSKWVFLTLFACSFSFLMYFLIKKVSWVKAFCTFIFLISFLYLSLYFHHNALIAYVDQELYSGDAIEICGYFLRMEDGYTGDKGGRGTPNVFAAFLIDNEKKSFEEFFNGTKEKILQLKEGDKMCLTYVFPPYPSLDLIVVDVRKTDSQNWSEF